MIDKPGRKPARFPPEMEPAVTREIAMILNSWDIGPEDLALCGGACGGDLIFAELCLKKDTLLEIRIPFHEPEFLRKSVNFAGDQWQSRFYKVKNNPNTKLLTMPDELGPLPQDSNPYERNNLWQLQTALSWDPKKVNFMCLWDKKPGDGPGGTEHMHEEVKKYSGKVHVIESIKLLKELE
jgi:hypothetical protein